MKHEEDITAARTDDHVLQVAPSIATTSTTSAAPQPITAVVRNHPLPPLINYRARAFSASSLVITAHQLRTTSIGAGNSPLANPPSVIPNINNTSAPHPLSVSSTVPSTLTSAGNTATLSNSAPLPATIHFKSERPSINAWDSDNENEAHLLSTRAPPLETQSPVLSRGLSSYYRNTVTADGIMNMELDQHEKPSPSLLISLPQILLIPIILALLFLFPPLQPPTSNPSSLSSNFVFLFTTIPLSSLNQVLVYTTWAKSYSGKTFRTPVIPIIVIYAITPVLIIFFSHRFPLEGMGLIAYSSYVITIPLSFFVRWKIAKLPHASVQTLQRFMQLHIVMHVQYLGCVAFLLFMKLSSNLALECLIMGLFALFTGLLKMILLDTTRLNSREPFHSLAAFWIEIYYDVFSMLAFPYYTVWTTYFLFLFLRIFTASITFVALTERWFYDRGWFLKLAESTMVTPVAKYSVAEFGVGASMSFGNAALSFKKSVGIRKRESKWPLFRMLRRVIFTNLSDRKVLINYSLRNYVCSSLAQIISPFYFILMALFMRYGWNRDYLPYKDLDSDTFVRTMLFATFAAIFSVMCIGVTAFVSWRSYRARLWTLAQPLLRKHRAYFIYATVSAFSLGFVSILDHFQILDLVN